jgi:glycosyltransferase involved in cell wall biosynthesis
MNENNYEFSLVIPIYNEIHVIEETLNEIRRLKKYNNFEIIIVDDCSNDGTCEFLDTNNLKDCVVVHHDENRGYGASIKTGIKHSNTSIIAITDADGTYPNDKIPMMMLMLEKENLDMVVGARTGQNTNIPLLRKPAKWVINKLANFLTGINIPDLNSGLRIMRKSVVENYIKLLPDGFSLTSTITLCMLTNGCKVKYTPIDYFKRKGKSKIKPIQDTINFVQLIIRTALYFNPLKIFIPLFCILLFLAFAILVGSWIFLDRIMDITFGVVLMTAIVVISIGMLADLIDKRT